MYVNNKTGADLHKNETNFNLFVATVTEDYADRVAVQQADYSDNTKATIPPMLEDEEAYFI